MAEAESDLPRAIENYDKLITFLEKVDVGQTNTSLRLEIAVSFARLGDLEKESAAHNNQPQQRLEQWRKTKDLYQKSLNSWQEIRAKGSLTSAEASRVGEVTREAARLDRLLKP